MTEEKFVINLPASSSQEGGADVGEIDYYHKDRLSTVKYFPGSNESKKSVRYFPGSIKSTKSVNKEHICLLCRENRVAMVRVPTIFGLGL